MAANKNQTKAAKAIAASSGGATVKTTGEVRLIIPLNSGRHAYVIHGGRTVHAATDSELFDARLAELAADGQRDRIRAELSTLSSQYPSHGWDRVLSRLEGSVLAS